MRLKLWIACLSLPVAAQVVFPPDLTVSRIEVVETVQNDGQTVALIAGKPAVARVFIKQTGRPENLVSGITVFLRGYRDGMEVASSPLRSISAPLTAHLEPDRTNPEHAQHFILPAAWTEAGTLEIRAELRVAPGTSEAPADNNTLSRTVEFVPPPVDELRISWLPFCAGDRCPASAPDPVLARRLLPISGAAIRYEDVPVPPVAVAEAPGVETDGAFLARLRQWLFLLEGSPLRSQLLIAPFPATSGESRGGAAGRVAWMPAPLSVATGAASLVRLMARSLGISAVDGECGARIGEPGYDVLAARPVSPDAVDVLAGCDDAGVIQWISPRQAQAFRAALGMLEGVDQQTALVVSGRIGESSGELTSAIQTVARTRIEPAAETNTCVRLTTTGSTSERCFEPLAGGSFTIRMPLDGSPRRVALLRDGAELAVAESIESPVVSEVTISEPADTIRTLRWQAADPQNRPLAFHVFYGSADGGWIPLAIGLRERELAVNTIYLRGSEIQFRVVAATGVDSGEALSESVSLAPAPVLAPPSASIDFANATTGQIAERTASIRNRGTAPLAIDTPEGGGESFAIGAPMPWRVRAGFERALPIWYRPQLPGLEKAELTTATDDPENPALTLSLTAAVFDRPVPNTRLAPASLDFGIVDVGTSSELTAIVGNEGTGPLTVTGASTVNARFRVISPLERFQLPPGGSRTIVVRFTPDSGGPQSGALNLATDNPTLPSAQVALKGEGRLVLAPSIDVSPTAIDFGSIAVGQNRILGVTVRNTGRGTLTLKTLATSRPVFFVFQPTVPVAVAPGAQQVVSVRFAPVAEGAIAGNLTIESDDPQQPKIDVSLSGNGTRAVPIPPPQLLSIIPAAVSEGIPAFSITVTGSGFAPASMVQFGGSNRPTTFLSNTRLLAALTAQDVASAGAFDIRVENPLPGGGFSTTIPLTVTASGPQAKITYISANCPVVFATISASDRINSSITDVNNINLTCLEDGVKVTCGVEGVEAAGSGLSIVMVLHSSATGNFVQQNMVNAALAFTGAIGEHDRLAITQMDNGVRLRRDFTEGENRDALADAVRQMEPPLGVGTSLYDAIEDGLNRLASQGDRRKAVVIFAASENTYPPNAPRDVNALFRRVQESGVSFYLVPIGDGFTSQALRGVLNQLAVDSYGDVLGDPNVQLRTALERLGALLQKQHRLNFTTTKPDGLPHRLGIRLGFAGMTLESVRTYPGCPAR